MDEPVWMPAVRYVMARCGEKVDIAQLGRQTSGKRDSVRLLVDFRSFFRRTLDALTLFRTRGSTQEFHELFSESVVDLLDAGLQIVFVLRGIRRNDAVERHARERKWKVGRREVRKMFAAGIRCSGAAEASKKKQSSSEHKSAAAGVGELAVAETCHDSQREGEESDATRPGVAEEAAAPEKPQAAADSKPDDATIQVVDRLWQRVALSALRSVARQYAPGSLICLRLMDADIDYGSLVDSMSALAVLTDDIRLAFCPRTPIMLLSSLDYSSYESGHFWASVVRPAAFAGALSEIAHSMASDSFVGSFTPQMLPDLGVLLSVSPRINERQLRSFCSRILPLARKTPFQSLAAAAVWLCQNCAPDGQLAASKVAEVMGPDMGQGVPLLSYYAARLELAGFRAQDSSGVEQEVLIKNEMAKRLDEMHSRLRDVSKHCAVDIWGEYVKGDLSVDMLRLCVYGTLPFDNRLEPSSTLDMDRRCSILIGRRLAAALGLVEVEWYSWDTLKLMHTRDSNIQSSGLWDPSAEGTECHRIYGVLGLQAVEAVLGVETRLTVGQLAVYLVQTIFPETSSVHLSLLYEYFASRAQSGEGKSLLKRMKGAPKEESLSVVYLVSCLEVCVEWVVNVNDVFACALYPRDVVAEQLLHFDPYDLTSYVEARMALEAPKDGEPSACVE